MVSISTLSAQLIWLDQPDLSAAAQGYRGPKKNRTVDGRVMTIAGQSFQRGFGTLAESSLFIQLGGKANSFIAIDDEMKDKHGVSSSVSLEFCALMLQINTLTK